MLCKIRALIVVGSVCLLTACGGGSGGSFIVGDDPTVLKIPVNIKAYVEANDIESLSAFLLKDGESTGLLPQNSNGVVQWVLQGNTEISGNVDVFWCGQSLGVLTKADDTPDPNPCDGRVILDVVSYNVSEDSQTEIIGTSTCLSASSKMFCDADSDKLSNLQDSDPIVSENPSGNSEFQLSDITVEQDGAVVTVTWEVSGNAITAGESVLVEIQYEKDSGPAVKVAEAIEPVIQSGIAKYAYSYPSLDAGDYKFMVVVTVNSIPQSKFADFKVINQNSIGGSIEDFSIRICNEYLCVEG